MDYQKLGKRIRSLRAQEEMTQDQLGEAAGYTGTHIGQIENARTVPSLEAVVNISNALHATPDELLMDSLESAELVYMHQIEKRLANMDLRTRIVACEMLEKRWTSSNVRAKITRVVLVPPLEKPAFALSAGFFFGGPL